MANNDVVTFSQIDNSSGSAISLNTTTGKITLVAGNTYRLLGAVPNFSGSRPSFMWYNETTSTYIGSATNGYSPSDGAGNGSFGGLAELVITPNVTTVVSFRLYASTSTIGAGSNADFSTAGIYPWFEAQVISGNAPVTGQSVDYVNVANTGTQTVVTGNNIKFNTIIAGNIPYDASTGNFTLTAGKTYRLSGFVTLDATSSGGNELSTTWRNAAGSNIGTAALLLSANTGSNANGQGVADLIYTPTTNTTVSLYVAYANGTAVTRANYVSATIQQIGSSAIVNPWTLSGTTTYNTTGNIGIGTNSPNASAILDLTSTTQGVLIPRMTSTQRAAISSPAIGLTVFQTDVNIGNYTYNGTSWQVLSNANYGDVKTGFQTGDHNGWIKLDGRLKSTLTSSQQTQATAVGIGTNLPNATDAFLVQNGTTLGSVSGSNDKTIAQANLPNVTLAGSTNSTGSHTHTISFSSTAQNLAWSTSTGGVAGWNQSTNETTSSNGSHSHTITTSSLNGGVTQTTLNITPKSLSINTFIYLGY